MLGAALNLSVLLDDRASNAVSHDKFEHHEALTPRFLKNLEHVFMALPNKQR